MREFESKKFFDIHKITSVYFETVNLWRRDKLPLYDFL
jgi:hypothetical protein